MYIYIYTHMCIYIPSIYIYMYIFLYFQGALEWSPQFSSRSMGLHEPGSDPWPWSPWAYKISMENRNDK